MINRETFIDPRIQVVKAKGFDDAYKKTIEFFGKQTYLQDQVIEKIKLSSVPFTVVSGCSLTNANIRTNVLTEPTTSNSISLIRPLMDIYERSYCRNSDERLMSLISLILTSWQKKPGERSPQQESLDKFMKDLVYVGIRQFVPAWWVCFTHTARGADSVITSILIVEKEV